METQSYRKTLPVVLAATCVALVAFSIALRRDNPVVVEPDTPAVRTAESAVAAFHDGLNQRRYEATCAVAERDAFRGMTGLKCAEDGGRSHQ
jgi:hypothetical protein